MFAMKTARVKALWIVLGAAVWALSAAHLPAASASGSVPVVKSTATPAPCTGNCHHVQPDVIAMTNPLAPCPSAAPNKGRPPLRPGGPISSMKLVPPPATPKFVSYTLGTTWLVSQVVAYPHELDIQLSSNGTHETIHVPFSVVPAAAALTFPANAKAQSVIGHGANAQLLWLRGTEGHFVNYAVSAPPFITAP